jgi:hypothetical protein
MHTPFDARRGFAVLLLSVMTGGLLGATGAVRAQAAATQTLTGAAAQKSPQADLFIAYEEALLDGGLEAADKYMSPAKRDEVKEMVKAYGMHGFRQMQAEKRKNRVPPEERRKRIQKVEISGDYAYLEAATERKGVLDVAAFLKTADGWKVTPVRR